MSSYNSSHTGTEHDQYVTKQALIDLVYPIGSLYMSINSTSPATLFGGTWESIGGKFLIGADTTYNSGSEGGSTTHNHTMAHTHGMEHTHTMAHTHTYAHTHTTPATTTGNHTLTLAEAPAHTHGRGTMDITGQWKIKGDANNSGVDAPATASGAFSAINETASGAPVGGTSWSCGTGFNFKASNNWSGATDSKGGGGAHNHPQVATTTNSQSASQTSAASNDTTSAASVSNTGAASNSTASTESNMPPYLAVYIWKRTA